MNKLSFSFICLAALSPSISSADAISDAKNLISSYSGSLQIDHSNSASMRFETLIKGQHVEFSLNSAALPTAFIKVLSSQGSSRICKPGIKASCENPDLLPTSFEQLGIFLDGCNVSAAVISLCSSPGSGCTLTGATSSGESPNLGEGVVMTSPLALNDLEASEFVDSPACERLVKSGQLLLRDQKHTLEFVEMSEEAAKGGKLQYGVFVKNKIFSDSL